MDGSDMTDEKQRRCVWCFSDDVGVVYTADARYHAKCYSCGALGDGWPNKEDAVHRWNALSKLVIASDW